VVRRQGAVRHVIVGGRVVVSDGDLAGADMGGITERAEQGARRLWQRMGSL
jgi:hypothetical protein